MVTIAIGFVIILALALIVALFPWVVMGITLVAVVLCLSYLVGMIAKDCWTYR